MRSTYFLKLVLALSFPVILNASAPSNAETEASKEGPQNKEDSPADASRFIVRVPVDVVVVHATVTDKKGNPVEDLTADDFKVYEDGKIRTIQSFAVESYQTRLPTYQPGQPVKSSPSPVPEPTPSVPPRLFSLFLDDLTSPSFADVYRSIEAIKAFVTESLGEDDQVSIVTASGRFQLPFTQDRTVLLEGVSQLHKKVNRYGIPRSDCPRLTDLQADRIRTGPSRLPDFSVALMEVTRCASLQAQMQTQDFGSTPASPTDGGIGEDITLGGIQTNSGGLQSSIDPEIRLMAESLVNAAALRQHEATQQRNRGLLKALSRHVQFLSYFEARKSLVLFSDGFLSQWLRHELEKLMDLSLRAGVVVSTVDIRGLYTTNMQASDRESVGSTDVHLLNERTRLREEDMMQQEEPLAELAHATGGTFFHNNNDLFAGLKSIAGSQSFYYVLTYGVTESRLDGRYHKIKVKVSRPGVRIRHRKGYFAPKERLSLETRNKRAVENDLEAVLYGPGNLRGVPVGLSYSYFRLDEATYQLDLLARIDIGGLSFLKDNGHRENIIHLVVAVLDDTGQYLKGSRKKVNLKLTDSGYAALRNYGLRTQVNLQLPRGRYKIKAVARDSVDTRLGSAESTLEVPPMEDITDLWGESSWATAADATLLTSQPMLDFGLSYFFDSPDLARIPISARLEGGAWQRKPSQGPGRLHFFGAAYAEDESVAAMFSETLDLTGDNRDVYYRNTVKLRPGSYRFELAVSDERGILGVAQRDLVVPALSSEGLASSSLVVSQQFLPMPEKIRKLQRTLVNEMDPFIYKDFKVVAPAEHQIRLDHPLGIFYKLYNLAGAESSRNLNAKIQLISERGVANRFPPMDLDGILERTAEGEATVFLGFKLPAQALAPGEYRLMVETTESSTGRTVTGATSLWLK